MKKINWTNVVVGASTIGALVAVILFVIKVGLMAGEYKKHSEVSISTPQEPLDLNPKREEEALFEDKRLSVDEASVVTLSARNTLVFREDFNVVSIAKLQNNLLKMSRGLSKSTPIYLVLDTPGGSVDAGKQLFDTVKGLGREVKTITIFAASMGFFTVESLGERLILPSGVLMAHRAFVGGIQGQVPGEANTRLNFILDQVTALEKAAATRIGTTHEKYSEAVRNEYWVEGEKAVRQNLADRVVTITCDDTLSGTETQRINLGFVSVDLLYSKCPAVTGFLGYEFVGNKTLSSEERAEATNVLSSKKRLMKHRLGNAL